MKNMSTFYSGDRDGFLCKVYLDPSGHAENDQCIVLAHEAQDNSVHGSGITSIVAYQDKFGAFELKRLNTAESCKFT